MLETALGMFDYFAVPAVAAFLLAQVAVLATSIYLHRCLAHRALIVHPFIDVI